MPDEEGNGRGTHSPSLRTSLSGISTMTNILFASKQEMN